MDKYIVHGKKHPQLSSIILSILTLAIGLTVVVMLFITTITKNHSNETAATMLLICIIAATLIFVVWIMFYKTFVCTNPKCGKILLISHKEVRKATAAKARKGRQIYVVCECCEAESPLAAKK